MGCTIAAVRRQRHFAMDPSGHLDRQLVRDAGEDHGSIISKGMPDIFAFFKAHSK